MTAAGDGESRFTAAGASSFFHNHEAAPTIRRSFAQLGGGEDREIFWKQRRERCLAPRESDERASSGDMDNVQRVST
jgi:hypothetical protein